MRQLNQNNLVDQRHLIALPYVDFFITDDRGLRNLIGRISARMPCPTATLLTKAEFDMQYPAQILPQLLNRQGLLKLAAI